MTEVYRGPIATKWIDLVMSSCCCTCPCVHVGVRAPVAPTPSLSLPSLSLTLPLRVHLSLYLGHRGGASIRRQRYVPLHASTREGKAYGRESVRDKKQIQKRCARCIIRIEGHHRLPRRNIRGRRTVHSRLRATTFENICRGSI